MNAAPPKPLAGRRLAALLAAMGAYALVAQTALLRQFLVIFGGNELALGLFFGAWFAGIGLGAAAAGRLADRRVPGAAGVFVVALVGALVPPACLIAMKTMPVWLRLPPGLAPTWTVIGLAGLLCAPQGFWIGAAFPAFSTASSDREAIGRMFVWEAIGAAAGGLLFSFVLAVVAPPFGAAVIASAILLAGAGYALRPTGFGWASLVLAVGAAAVAFSPAGAGVERALERARFAAAGVGADFDATVQTRYQSVSFARAAGHTQLYGDGAYLDSFPDPYAHQQQAILLLALRPRPARIALLDGGLTGLAGELLRSPCLQRLDIAYLDARMAQEITQRLPESERGWTADPRLHVAPKDARAFLRESTESYDLIAVLAPDPSTALLNRLYTREFFAIARRRLAAEGALVLSLTGAANYVGEETGPYIASAYATLAAVFPRVAVYPDDQAWLAASPAGPALSDDPTAMKANYLAAFDGRPPAPPESVDLYVIPERIGMVRDFLAANPGAINGDLRPVSYVAFLRIWDQFAGGRLRGPLAALATASVAAPLGLAAIVGLMLVALPAFGSAASAAGRYGLVSVASSGFCAMGVTIVASLAYQAMFGQMYQMVALLFAAYMAGLALGGGAATAVGEQGRGPARWLLVGDAWLAACAAGLALFLPWAVERPSALTQALLIALVALSGVGAGLAFPLAAQALAASGEKVGRRAGRIDSLDHLAAMLGSLIVGTILLPILGAAAVFALLAGLKTASFLGGVVAERRGAPARGA
jgi:spermidine synthase